ncbi:MAG: DoxX family protein [Nitrososphaera sp.]
MNAQRLIQFGPFPLRVALSITFLAHRVPTLAEFDKVQGFVGSLGLPPELAFVVATLELGGAIAILLGILTRITAGFFIILMASTSLVVKLSRGFLGGFEVDVLLLTMAASLLITGPGRISIEWHLLKRELVPNGRKLVPVSAKV